jgi:hypothetical protein
MQLGMGKLVGIVDSEAEPQLEAARVGNAQPDPVGLSTRANRNLRGFLKKRLRLPVRQIPVVEIDAVSIWQVPHLISCLAVVHDRIHNRRRGHNNFVRDRLLLVRVTDQRSDMARAGRRYRFLLR